MGDEQVTVNAAWLAELGRDIAELKATNAVLVEALDNLLEECTKELGDPEDYIAALNKGNETIAKVQGGE